MVSQDPVVSIGWPSDSGSGDAEGPKFIRCVDGREPQIHEVWAFVDDGVTREVHPNVRVDFYAGVVGEFLSDYLTESGCRIPIIRRISINGSVEYLGVPGFHRTGGTFWAANLLAPRSSWGDSGTTTNQNCGSQPWVPSGSVAVPWNHPIFVLPVYVRRILEKCGPRP